MALFERFRISRDEIEAKLNRPLTGSPGTGEQGVLMHLNRGEVDEAHRRIERDPTIGSDAKEFFERHLRAQAGRWEAFKSWSVDVPLPIWDEFARESRLNHTPISRCFTAALRRDYDRRAAALEPTEALRAEIRSYHTTQQTFLQQAQEIVTRLADVQQIGLRLDRIERCLSRPGSR